MKISYRAILHRLLPHKVGSPQCAICTTNVDSLEYFLFGCPPKTAVWQTIIQEFLWPTVDTEDIYFAFKTLDFYSVSYY